jgi:hypothetical protein
LNRIPCRPIDRNSGIKRSRLNDSSSIITNEKNIFHGENEIVAQNFHSIQQDENQSLHKIPYQVTITSPPPPLPPPSQEKNSFSKLATTTKTFVPPKKTKKSSFQVPYAIWNAPISLVPPQVLQVQTIRSPEIVLSPHPKISIERFHRILQLEKQQYQQRNMSEENKSLLFSLYQVHPNITKQIRINSIHLMVS